MRLITCSILVSVAATLLSSANAQNAFAGAVGFGAIATGGNSGSTYHVTTLADSGTGSFVSGWLHHLNLQPVCWDLTCGLRIILFLPSNTNLGIDTHIIVDWAVANI